MGRLRVVTASLCLLTLAAYGQTGGLHFDVVAIRESRSATPWEGSGMSLRGGFLQVHTLPLKSLITSAYGVHEDLVFGLPGWAETAHYQIRARVTDADPAILNNPSREQRRALMAALLEDRFHLKLHEATKVMPLYELVVAKDGPKFKESNPTGELHSEVSKTEYIGTNVIIVNFTSLLQEIVERPVVDKTGLGGKYDLHLTWNPDLTGASDRDSLPSIFTAVQEQLGLKLQPGKGPVKTLVVDRIERPSEN